MKLPLSFRSMTTADTQGVVRCMVTEDMGHIKAQVQLVSYITSHTIKTIEPEKKIKSQMVFLRGRWTC